ncbi:MAG: class 1 fructose-bisphosphatase [Candidatus Methylomirabilia bacterium]
MSEITLTLAHHVRTTGGEEADDLAVVLGQLALAGKLIARELARAALVGQLGITGETNVQGEAVKKLDVWANDVVVKALEVTGLVCTLISEEIAEPLHLARHCKRARYVVCFDPVDGSSNLDVNGIVGTVFSIRRRRASGTDHVAADSLQPGTAQVAAGYIMYGPGTVLIYTAGDGVHGFTLDPTVGEFMRSHQNIRIPARGRTYSVNEGNAPRWDPSIRRYIEHLRVADVPTGRPYTARYVGSLVADFHRTLLEGGIFLYPADAAAAGKATGKLRLLYEAAPMGFVAEQAGGKASTGSERILEIHPISYHQRVPLLIGSPEEVTLAEEFLAGRR